MASIRIALHCMTLPITLMHAAGARIPIGRIRPCQTRLYPPDATPTRGFFGSSLMSRHQRAFRRAPESDVTLINRSGSFHKAVLWPSETRLSLAYTACRKGSHDSICAICSSGILRLGQVRHSMTPHPHGHGSCCPTLRFLCNVFNQPL
jgi:hypothetical protein